MTLFRQITITITLGLFILSFTLMWNNVNQSNHFLQGQVATHNQNITVIETFVNRGRYSKIKLVSIDKELLFEKSRNISMGGISNWFIELVPQNFSMGTSQIMMGWLPYGTLMVTLHPGYVYSGIYINLKTSSYWVLMVVLLGFSVLWLFFKVVLKPLARDEVGG